VDQFSRLVPLGWGDWDFVGLSLLGGDSGVGSIERRLRGRSNLLTDVWSAILAESWKGYGGLWPEVQDHLSRYRFRLETDWDSIGIVTLERLRRISRADWNPEHVDVYLVDCLYGAASYMNTILIAPVADMEIEKKLLCHELSESAFAGSSLLARLERNGIDPSVAHTIVDTAAYFALRPWLKPEYVDRLKPKASYYPKAESVYMAFERCEGLSGGYPELDELLGLIKAAL
jgi:hypothetical protein